MPNNRRCRVLTASSELKTEVAVRFLRRHESQPKIAKAVGISQGRVSQIIKEFRQECLEERKEAVEQWQAVSLAKLRHLAASAWHAYELSCAPSRETHKEQEQRLKELKEAVQEVAKARKAVNGKVDHKNGGYKKGRALHNKMPKVTRVDDELEDLERRLETVAQRVKEVVKDRAEGNPKFMDIVRWCCETELKMCGLLKQEIINQDNRQGVFMGDFWQALVTPPEPVPDDRPNEVAMRIEAMAREAVEETNEAKSQKEDLPGQ